MSYGNYPQRIRRGQTWTLAGTYKISGSPVDLHLYTGQLAINTWPKGVSALYTSTAVTLNADGTFIVTVPASQTLTWPANGPRAIDNRLIYDLSCTDPSGNVTYLMSGELIVEETAGNV